MTATDYTEILRQQVGTAKVPQPLPEGVYYGQIDGVPKPVDRKMKDGSTVGVLQVKAQLFEAADGVDQDALAEAGGLVSEDGRRRSLAAEFWLVPDELYQLDAFLAGFGHTADSGVSYIEALQALSGQAVALTVTQREYNGRIFNDVKKMVAQD